MNTPAGSLIVVFDLEKSEHEGQGQIRVPWWEVLVARSLVCKYERNRSRNEKVMCNVKVFADRPTDRQADSYIPPSNFVCGGIIIKQSKVAKCVF